MNFNRHARPPLAAPLAVAFLAFLQASCLGGSSGSATARAVASGAHAADANFAAAGMSNLSVPNNHIPPVSACINNAPAMRVWRRLTLAEVNSSVVDLFADPTAPQASDLFTNDPTLYGFHDMQQVLSVGPATGVQIQTFAEAVGAYAATHVSAISSCQTQDATCETTFVQTFGARVFRGPIASDDVQSYVQLFAGMPSFASGVDAVVSAMLQSPYFLYRSELGIADPNHAGLYQLTPYEIASEISYFIVGSMPDAALQQAASNNTLLDPNVRDAQVARLLQDPRAHKVVAQFLAQWLQVSELAGTSRMEGNVTLSADIMARMSTELQMLSDEVVFANQGKFSDLMAVDHTFVDPTLSAFYQNQSTASTGAASRTTFASLGRDAGLLSLGGVQSASSQATYASPTLRGRLVRMRMLCQTIPAPPPGVPQLEPAQSSETTRQRFENHVSNAECNTCHTLMDTIGFTMGDYDTVGRRRPGNLENGAAIDTQGRVNSPASGSSEVVADITALDTYLAQSAQAQACLTRHWTMYALGQESWAQDGCTFDAVAAASATTQFKLLDVVLAITHTLSFTQRTQD